MRGCGRLAGFFHVKPSKSRFTQLAVPAGLACALAACALELDGSEPIARSDAPASGPTVDSGASPTHDDAGMASDAGPESGVTAAAAKPFGSHPFQYAKGVVFPSGGQAALD